MSYEQLDQKVYHFADDAVKLDYVENPALDDIVCLTNDRGFLYQPGCRSPLQMERILPGFKLRWSGIICSRHDNLLGRFGQLRRP